MRIDIRRLKNPAALLHLVSVCVISAPKLAAQAIGGSAPGSAISSRARRIDDRGPIEVTKQLSRMTLVFRRTPEQHAELDRLLQQQQDPSSPSFHKWLTPDEFGERFGLHIEDLNRLVTWLRAQGFAVENLPRGRGWIEFSGTVAQAQHAFRTEIHRYQAGSKAHFAPATPVSIPPELEHFIGGVRGLDDFYLEPFIHLEPMYTASNGTHALAPGDVATIYDFTGLGGGGQTIAVVGASAVDLADIRQFKSTFLLPANDPQILLAGDDPGVDSGGALQEADADLEWVGAVAPWSTIVYAYATDVVVASQYVIDQNTATILSFSFGNCEPNISQTDAAFVRDLAQQANAQGITWIAASGDAGAAACDQGSYPATQGLAVSFPASLPEVTGVGGTEFNEQGFNWGGNSQNLSSAEGYIPEVGWNDTSVALGLRASGGGASVLFSKPSWQSAPGVPEDDARDVPDLAFSASPTHDPYLVISGGQTYGGGGTSLSTPVFAGILALREPAGLGNINPWLYAAAAQSYAGPSYASSFHDITTGSNIVPCVIGTTGCSNGVLGYSAGPGYDLVTGLGSVDVARLPTPSDSTTTTLSVSSPQVAEGQAVTLTAVVRSSGGPIPAGVVEFLAGGSFVPGTQYTSLDATGTATATVLLAPGSYAISATYLSGFFTESATGFAISSSAPVTVIVAPAPPLAPTLISPADGATGASVTVSLNWNKSPFAGSYDVNFGTSPSPPFWGNVTGTLCYLGALASGTKYYWQVAARNGSGATPSEVWSFTTTNSAIYTISTIAGSNSAGFSPDGTLASSAALFDPTDVALDSKGNLYLAEAGNNRIRMINAAGILSTVAGGGTGGDGGPATQAELSDPAGIAIDRQGNLYISDDPYNTSRIRKVSPAGIITTIAGGSTPGYSGDGGPAANAQLHGPSGLAVDSQGNLYIADTRNGCVREIAAGVISTFAGQCGNNDFAYGTSVGDGGPASMAILYYPQGVAVDTDGNVYIADSGNCRIRRVSNGVITTVVGSTDGLEGCGGGNLPPAVFTPIRVAIDSAANLYFTSGFGDDLYGVWIVKFANGAATTIAGGGPGVPGGGGPGTDADIGGAGGLASGSGGSVYFAEASPVPGEGSWSSQRVLMLSPSNTYSPLPPSIAAGGIRNGASFAPAPLAAGSIAAAFGSFGDASPGEANATPPPTTMAGLSLQFEPAGINAPLLYVSAPAGQVNFQIPWELAGQSSATVHAVLNGNSGPSQTLPLASFAPGIFVVDSSNHGAVLDTSGNLVGVFNPTTAGRVIQIYCTGLGAVVNAPPGGSPAPVGAFSPTTTTPMVTIGGIQAQVLFSGLAPGTVGEYQVNVQVPQGVTSGTAVPLAISIGSTTSNTVALVVQ